MIEQLRGGYSDRLLREALDVHRGSLYHEPRPLREALIALAGRWPTYGYRRLTVMLRREGHTADGRAWSQRRAAAEASPDDQQRPLIPPLPEPGRASDISIRGWNLGPSLQGELTLTALRRAIDPSRPEIHHSDRGRS